MWCALELSKCLEPISIALLQVHDSIGIIHEASLDSNASSALEYSFEE